ncbi:MAG: hypothetical protein J6Y28_06770 [Acholeplasmatales bacterium]|nr:hypothetical protein [Acholeplasmatales bacterium]
MSKIASILSNDEIVRRYIELRRIITSNDEYMALLKSELSLNNANIESFEAVNIINEYLELEKIIKNDLDMISNIINDGINVNFLA